MPGTVYRSRTIRPRLRDRLVDAALGLLYGIPLGIGAWLLTLWWFAQCHPAGC